MSAGRSRDPVVLTSYSFDEKSSMETYLDEYASIRHTQATNSDTGSETEEEKDDQGNAAIFKPSTHYGSE